MTTNALKIVKIPVLDRDTCEDWIGSENFDEWRLYTRFDSGDRRIYDADFGSPLACRVNGNFVLYGVTSSLYGNACGAPRSPALFARVSFFGSWIKKYTGLCLLYIMVRNFVS